MLTTKGFIIPKQLFTPEHRKCLTVRAEVNGDFGFPPPPFRVYRVSPKNVSIPRYYGQTKIGLSRDKRENPEPMNVNFKGVLRESNNQPEAFKSAIETMNGTGGGVLSLPCGFGKTTVSLAIACEMKVRTMIVVHKEFLANQWEERIREFCPTATIGRVQQNRVEVDNDFVICMLQSLSQKEYTEEFNKIGLLIVDEAHHICARVFSQALFKLCPKYTLGLTATPDRADKLTKVLYWFLGPLFYSIERENQKQVVVERIEYKDDSYKLAPPLTRMGKISLAEMITTVTLNEKRNQMLLKLIESIPSSRNILVLTDRRDHCFYLKDNLKRTSSLYMGGMKEADLKESEKSNVIIGTFSQAHEGLDIPKLDTLILATPKSNIKQAVGRILRETPGKVNDPLIFDIRDHWTMIYNMFYKRNKVYREGGFKIESECDNPFKGKCLL